jgi:stage V sporulation protein R
MNEGWATFWHHTLLTTLYEDGRLADGFMMECLASHTNVIFQPSVGDPRYSGLNPYALGFAMFTDLRRICEQPTAEDRAWFPDIAGSDWVATLDHAMRHYKDESFIGQYLSPRLMREMRLFSVVDDANQSELEVSAIHDESGWRHLREALARQYDLNWREPAIQVWNVNLRGDRSLLLRHLRQNDRPLSESAREVVKHLARLWGFRVRLESVDAQERVIQHWEVTPAGAPG